MLESCRSAACKWRFSGSLMADQATVGGVSVGGLGAFDFFVD
jgi:hypothetical protein